MSDLDILVPFDRGGDCVSKLAALGYIPNKSEVHPRMHTFASFFGPSGTAPVDLHREALAYPYEPLLPVDDVIAEATTHELDGVRLAAPSPTHQVIHNIAHAQLNDHAYVYGHLPLQALHDFALITQKWGDRLDWPLIESGFCANGYRSALAFHCMAAQALLHAKPNLSLSPNLSQRALLRRARFMIDYPTLQRTSDRFVRVFLLFGRELSDTELRTRLARNMRRSDWWRRHLGFFRQGVR